MTTGSVCVAEDLGFTEPNAAGPAYRHGTPVRLRRWHLSLRTAGTPSPTTGPNVDRSGWINHDDPHLNPPRRACARTHGRNQIWRPSCAAVGLSPAPRMHDLREAHTSWLPAADLQLVRERLGQTIATTEKYLHTLRTADTSALDRIRYGR